MVGVPISTSVLKDSVRSHLDPEFGSGLEAEGGRSTGLGPGTRISEGDVNTEIRVVSVDPYRTTRCESQISTLVESRNLSRAHLYVFLSSFYIFTHSFSLPCYSFHYIPPLNWVPKPPYRLLLSKSRHRHHSPPLIADAGPRPRPVTTTSPDWFKTFQPIKEIGFS